MDEHTPQHAFTSNTGDLEALQQLTPEEIERRWMELLRDPAPASDPHQVPFDLKSIVNATHATIKYRDKYGEDMYQFNIIPGGYFPGSPKTFTITNIPDEEEHMKNEKETFLKEILGKRIVLTVDHMKPADIILHRDSESSNMLGGVYVFELVTGAAASEAGGGGAAGGGGSQGGGKSVRRRSRKSYSRRRRVSNKKYSASRRGRGRGRGRGRRSRKN